MFQHKHKHKHMQICLCTNVCTNTLHYIANGVSSMHVCRDQNKAKHAKKKHKVCRCCAIPLHKINNVSIFLECAAFATSNSSFFFISTHCFFYSVSLIAARALSLYLSLFLSRLDWFVASVLKMNRATVLRPTIMNVMYDATSEYFTQWIQEKMKKMCKHNHWQ